ncbi:MAG: carbamoyltransferase [Bacteroidetes bacterium]|nr:carbamoyltransferase [Bacteroidota bacterium]
MKILGISAFYHDSAAALICSGEIIAAAQEERFTRKKHDAGFPANSIRFCLDYSGLSMDNLDAIVFYDKPLLKFERLLETYYGFAPQGLRSFLTAIPVWLKEKMLIKSLIKEELAEIERYDKRKIKLLFPEHHLSHAASAFYPSPFEESAILTIDGVGEWATASICHGKSNGIKILRELHFPHSLGLLYSAFTYYLGFRVNSGEYKLMGLAPYGNPGSVQVEDFVAKIKNHIIRIQNDGSLWMNQQYFDYAAGLRMADERKWEKLFGFKRRKPEDELQLHHCNLGLAIQRITEECVTRMAHEAKRLTGSDHLCLAGGVALNCVANGKLQREKIFRDIFIQPAAGDAGGAVGSALAAYHIYFNKPRIGSGGKDMMKGAYLGPEFETGDMVRMARKFSGVYTEYNRFEDLASGAARLISGGASVGWFQGRMEFGPRALGNRSILGDARNPEMQKKLNLKIKYRESFRPFAPAVLYEDSGNYFDMESPSPYMLLVYDVLTGRRKELPPGFNKLPVREKLYFQRSDIPSVTHIDFSARIQTVHRETNEKFWILINEFKKLTGYSVIVNTSFNVRGEPIVCTPEDAYRCFMRTELDYLVTGNFLFDKKIQPQWKESKKCLPALYQNGTGQAGKEDFVLD